ncbi:hypothetical protein LRP67_16145 [Nocardioides sp. cx-169]|uniref:hypothetical protein n=1 Tax=Nocardioides sp. cx-169 TaxID=2899080 RepID=UPI001E516B70|nr:hypothetical protein [Nocardioides sp. cx-169]MCD4535624.1 hypothetical protein [Nocardioides sp. cx-169]
MTYRRSDPLDPPLVEVNIDGAWWPGVVEAQELRDGEWHVCVVWQQDGNRRGWFPAGRVRGDGTDWARGRDVGGDT